MYEQYELSMRCALEKCKSRSRCKKIHSMNDFIHASRAQQLLTNLRHINSHADDDFRSNALLSQLCLDEEACRLIRGHAKVSNYPSADVSRRSLKLVVPRRLPERNRKASVDSASDLAKYTPMKNTFTARTIYTAPAYTISTSDREKAKKTLKQPRVSKSFFRQYSSLFS